MIATTYYQFTMANCLIIKKLAKVAKLFCREERTSSSKKDFSRTYEDASGLTNYAEFETGNCHYRCFAMDKEDVIIELTGKFYPIWIPHGGSCSANSSSGSGSS